MCREEGGAEERLTNEVKNWKMVRNRPRYLAGLLSWMYSCEKVMK